MTPPSLARHDVVRIRGQRWRVVAEDSFGDTSLLDVHGCDAGNQGLSARFVLPCERLERLPATHRPRVVRPARWRRVARLDLSETTPHVHSLRAPARAAIRIMPFQLEPALAVTRGLATRILIADAVGLGKTIQAALIVAEVLERTRSGHALVVCPAALRDQWQAELRDRFGLAASIIDSPALASAAWSPAGAHPWTASPVVVTSVDFVKRPEVIRALEPIVWDALVLDEAHALSGASERTRAAHALAGRSRLVVLLSATPHSGDDAAFSRLCTIGALPGDPQLLVFRRSRADAGLPSTRRTRWLRIRTTGEETELHRSLLEYAGLVWRQRGRHDAARLAMSVLMKRACSSAASAHRSLERRLHLLSLPSQAPDHQPMLPFDTGQSDDAEPWTVLAAPGLHDPEDERRRLQALMMLAWRASRRESKVQALARFLRRCGEPAVVFTEYRDTLEHVRAALTDRQPLHLHGSLTTGERREVLQAFARGQGDVLLATDAASEGLNLHHRCRLVVNVELPWTPLRLEQRIGRVDRIGQARPVHAIHLVAGGTSEETIVARLLARSARASSALSVASSPLTERDVAESVIRGAPACDPLVQPATAGIRAVDLRPSALLEAAHIETARTLRPPAGTPADIRPVLTARRRRPRRQTPGCFWVFRVCFADASGRVVWSTLIPIAAVTGRPGGLDVRAPDAVRALLAPERPHLLDAIGRAHDEALASLTSSLRPQTLLAVRREQAIAGLLQRTRARLAVRQPGLFDRRADRTAAAQTAVLDDALSMCAGRLEHLASLGTLALGDRALAFAIALE